MRSMHLQNAHRACHSIPRVGFWVVLLWVLSTLGACASRQSREQAASTAPPVLPVRYSYKVWDHHFIQWLPDHPRYEAVEALVDETDDKPLIHLFLTDREPSHGSKTQHHYVNDHVLAEMLRGSSGQREVHEVDISWSRHEEGENLEFEFEAETVDGPLKWLFVTQGRPSAENGAGLIDNAEAAHDLAGGFLVFFLERGTLSGPATCLAIDDQSYAVKEWSELSSPPYFTAYRAAYSQGVHLGYFYATPQIAMRLVESSNDLSEGAHWTYEWSTADMPTRTSETRLVEASGNQLQFVAEDTRWTARRSSMGLAIERISVEDAASSMTLDFDSPLPDLVRMSDGTMSTTFTISQGEHQGIVSGTLTIEKHGTEVSVGLDPSEPAWARALMLEAHIELGEGSSSYSSEMVFPGAAD